MRKTVWGRLAAFFVLIGLTFTVAPLVPTANATANYWTATSSLTANASTLTMVAGEKKSVTVAFKNTSAFTWKKTGDRYVSLYTQGPKYRASVFQAPSWPSAGQVAKLKETSVKPGASGTVVIDLVAPAKVGTYKETFGLAAQDTAWLTGGQITLNIKVVAKKADVSAVPTPAPVAAGPTGTILAKSASKLDLVAGQSGMVTVALKNTGAKAWSKVSLSLPSAIAASSFSFRHLSWLDDDLAQANGPFGKNAVAEITFFVTAPDINGVQNLTVTPRADGEPILGAEFTLPIEVTGGAADVVDAPLAPEGAVAQAAEMIPEPSIRVGVLIVDEETNNEVVIGSDESAVDVITVSGTVLATIPVGGKFRAAYEGGAYSVGAQTVSEPVRFVPQIPNAVLTIRNFDRRLTRDTSFANNTFRNVLELRYNQPNDRTWLINELPMEFYLRGSAEVSDLSPVELQKTMMAAARTYAFYHWAHATKHADEGYQVDAYRDQVYWGYGQEERTPRLTAAIEATRGVIVTYNGETAITPYFSRSDGRTRAWSDVWAGAGYAWIKSVPVPCDAGKTLWGHGIGMSASGATCMARDGQLYDQILKYFYQGIELTKKWN